MKIKISIYGLLMVILSSTSSATQIQKKSLEELVEMSDHIIAGKVESVILVDKDGTVIEDDEAGTAPTIGNSNTMYLEISVSKVLKSNSSELPKKIKIELWNKWHSKLAITRKRREGKQYIFLLKGQDFRRAYPSLFIRETREEVKIIELLNRK